MSEISLPKAGTFLVAGYLVEPSILRVSGHGKEARLEAKAMQVLLYLVEHAGRVVSRVELEGELWPGRIVTEDSVTNAISKLRRVFGDDARRPRVIETVPKSGYRLIGEVTPIDTSGDAGRMSARPAAPSGRKWRTSWFIGAVAALLLLMTAWWLLERDGALAAKPAVAVLPFENLGATPAQDYFANGITADLITDLSKLSGLLVFAPDSAHTGDAAEDGRREIFRGPNLDYLVVGSVQRLGERLRINVQIIEVSIERTLWGERYDGLVNDVFELQDRLTAAVTAALKVELSPQERVILAKRPTASVVAYDHYLRGFEEHGGRSEVQNLSARAHFEKAIELDPAFARAYVGLAMTHSRDAIDGWTMTPSRSLEVAESLAKKAVGMDPSLPQVHFVTGQVALFQRRHLAAIEAAERAIAADHNYADAYALLAWTLNYAGRPDDALPTLERAMTLHPRPPASYLEILGEIRFAQGRYEEASSTFQRVLAINPSYTRARMWNAAALARAGSLGEAEWEAAELLAASPEFALDRLERAFPFKNPRTLDVLLDGLRKAGLPAR